MKSSTTSQVGILAGMLAMLLSGCAIGPDYHQPGVNVSSHWMEAENEKVVSKPIEYADWWRVFNDPVLDELIVRAYRENLTLQIAGARVLEARARLGIAFGELFPQPQANGAFQYNRASSAGVGSNSGTEFRQSQIGLGASWELDFWGRFRRGIESARADWLASVADYDNALVSLTAEVATAYINIRTVEKRLEIARQNVAIEKASLEIAQTRFEHGTVTQLDIEQAQTFLNDTLATIPSLETQLKLDQDALCLLLGMAPTDVSDYLKGSSDIPISPPAVVVGIPADLLRRRPDIRSAEYQAMAQSAQIGIAKADLFPAFSLNGTFGFLSTNSGDSKLRDLFQWKSRFAEAGPQMIWNILDFGRITNNVRAQDARLQELLLAYQNAVLNAQKEVEDNLSAFLNSQERAQALGKSAEAAQKALDLALSQYREGTKDFTTVLTAHQALLNEQDSLEITLGDIANSLVGVYRALGGGWEIREGKDLVAEGVKEEMTGRTNWGKLLAPAVYNPTVFEKSAP